MRLFKRVFDLTQKRMELEQQLRYTRDAKKYRELAQRIERINKKLYKLENPSEDQELVHQRRSRHPHFNQKAKTVVYKPPMPRLWNHL